MNILAIDYGKKYFGLALADGQLKIATPYKVLEVENQDPLFKQLKEIINQEKIQKIVVGRPISLSGRVTEQTKIIDQFIKKLKKQIKLPVISFDERLTSKMANKLLQGPTLNHAVAASIILQDYLDRL
ncbi:Holliday junction resolvase RuvX [Patescibacteria group bacterium]|nr:Holliday junction resolvase RuvX [Patescibacteria group bacterium]